MNWNELFHGVMQFCAVVFFVLWRTERRRAREYEDAFRFLRTRRVDREAS